MTISACAERVTREAIQVTGMNEPPPFALALRAAVLVRSMLSRPYYLSLAARGAPLPQTQDGLRAIGAGQCGDQAQLFVDVMRKLGFDAQQWGFRYGDDRTHVGTEIAWNGEWHYFDITWGAYWGEAAQPWSLDEVLEAAANGDLTRERVADEFGLSLTGDEDPFEYLDPDVDRWLLTNTHVVIA